MVTARRLLAFAPAMFIVGLTLAALAAPVNAQSGAWKLREGNPVVAEWASVAHASQTAVVVFVGDNDVKYKWEGVDANRTPIVIQYDARFDGKEYPVTGVDGYFVSVKRIDTNTIESVWRKDGQIILKDVSKTSTDGKTRTSTLWRSDPHGQTREIKLVYDKMDIACGPKFCEKQCKGKCGNGASCDCPKK